jgi:hypothetical protein
MVLSEFIEAIFLIMDNFTLAVIVGDIAMCLAFIALIVFDKPRRIVPATEPVKPAGKR